jgi:peptidoglycan/LPS O-acetylase OafA/YrhL
MTITNDVHRFHDGWRIAAASTVLLSHAWALGVIGSDTELLGRLAHLAVIIFFVISGHAVASSLDRHKDIGRFVNARLSRVYAIALPALFLTLVLDLAVGVSNTGYPEWQYPRWWLHIALNLAFLGETWHMHHRPFSVIPYWSLAYEFWYYMLIAAFSMKPNRWSLVLQCLAIVIAGPKVLMLIPCWLLGVWLYKYRKSNSSPIISLGFISATLLFSAILAAYLWSGLDLKLQTISQAICSNHVLSSLTAECGYSKWFLADYPVAIMFAFVSLTVLAAGDKPMAWVKKLAPHTFGIYLLHYPILLAFATLFKPPHKLEYSLLMIVAAFVLTVGLSFLFDKSRPLFTRTFERIISKVS